MDFLKILIVCLLAVGVSGCRKKPEAAAKEVREAGYAMTSDGWFEAVRANDVVVMGKMVAGGFDGKIKDGEGNDALHIAVSSGSKEAGEYLLNRGFSVDAKSAGGRTPLMAAVLAERPEMVQWLLRQGADPKLKNDDGFMALMLAVTNGGRASVEELAPYHREDLDSAILLASLVGQAGVIDALTNYGASVYARMEDGRTLLMLAAQNGHKEAVAMLIDIGASRFATIESGDTAQSLAVAAGHGELVGIIEKGFPGDSLTLESDEEVAVAINAYLDGFQEETEGGDELASNDGDDESKVPWNTPLAGQGGGQFGVLPEGSGDAQAGQRTPAGGALIGAALGGAAGAEAAVRQGRDMEEVGSPIGGVGSGLEGLAGRSATGASIEGASIGKLKSSGSQNPSPRQADEDLPLVMRHYRQRELPVEVKQVSGGVASLHIAGEEPREIKVKVGETIPGSSLVIVKVFTRTEHGKLNGGAPVEVGIVEVEDSGSGQKTEWLAGRPATGHDPVALVEDAATGRRYIAKPGQKFSSEDGRGFIVNDVRPSQLIIEEVATGEVRTLRLRGPKG
jgi:hypothetical protein